MKKILDLSSQFCEDWFVEKETYPETRRIASGIADQLKDLGWSVKITDPGDAYTFNEYEISPPPGFWEELTEYRYI